MKHDWSTSNKGQAPTLAMFQRHLVIATLMVACCCAHAATPELSADRVNFYSAPVAGLPSQAVGSKKLKIVEAALPLSVSEAARVRAQLVNYGMDTGKAGMLADAMTHGYYLTMLGSLSNVFDGTRPKSICLALTVKAEALSFGIFAPEKPPDLDSALLAFIAVHEKAHCLNRQERQDMASIDGADNENVEWRNEATADIAAFAEMRRHGRAGYAAAQAWRTKRWCGFLSGDLSHWTIPLVNMVESARAGEMHDVAQAYRAIGGDQAFEQIRSGWDALLSALFAGEDGGKAQADAWNRAVEVFPSRVRSAIPSIDDTRRMAQAAWPGSADWRLRAIDRKKAPKGVVLEGALRVAR
jgi:hypothetical protein